MFCKFHTFIIFLTAGRAGKKIRLGYQVKGSLQAAVDARTEGTRSVKTKRTGCSQSATKTSAAGARTHEIKVRTRTHDEIKVRTRTHEIKVRTRTHEIKVRPITVGSLSLRFTPWRAAKDRVVLKKFSDD